ncbi:unnamed protein product, partial [Citrullus colocynthis]
HRTTDVVGVTEPRSPLVSTEPRNPNLRGLRRLLRTTDLSCVFRPSGVGFGSGLRLQTGLSGVFGTDGIV